MTFRKKILLLDYEPRVTALARKALEATGRYVIKEEHDHRQALNAAKWFQPDLILFDVHPSRAGHKIARALQADPILSETPVVFLSPNTGLNDGRISSAGLLSGYSFFANPIRMDDFVRYVGELFKVPTDLLKNGYRSVGAAPAAKQKSAA